MRARFIRLCPLSFPVPAEKQAIALSECAMALGIHGGGSIICMEKHARQPFARRQDRGEALGDIASLRDSYAHWRQPAA
jgi:hypothetical protein